MAKEEPEVDRRSIDEILEWLVEMIKAADATIADLRAELSERQRSPRQRMEVRFDISMSGAARAAYVRTWQAITFDDWPDAVTSPLD